ncbi:6-hydroxymethylpterin diphosphokinase MptE-like protein [Ectothiorhodospira shaposhnikovii]|uniref:motility associated factor glycosyltransferase family protein n=1 Tax=Ectothiorhodospira shaposhnikovii TaxID=1054 RepID=UPI0039A1BA06
MIADVSENASFFSRNLEALERRNPALAELLRCDSTVPNDIWVESGRTGLPTLKAQDTQGAYYLHSLYDPVREAKGLVDKELSKEGLEVVVVLGAGLGYHLEAVLDKVEKDVSVVVVEPDPAALRLAMHHRDLTRILESDSVIWVVDARPQVAVERVVQALDAVTIRAWAALLSPPLSRRYMAFAKPFVLVLGSSLNTLRLNLNTQIKAADLFMGNAFRNLPYLAGSPGVLHLRDAWKERPVLVIAAGPSLNQHLDLLKSHQDRILMIAVGQAWRTLRGAGIEPHFVATVDPFDANLAHFEGMVSRGARLLADAGTHPGVVAGFNGPRVFCYARYSVDILISRICGFRGVLQSGGSVANTAFSFAWNLGASPVILVGQDLAFTGGVTHAAGNAYRTKLEDIEESCRRHWREVPGYYGDTVTTNAQMDVYRHWFERVIVSQGTSMRVINATEGGARIEGAEQMPLAQALSEWASKEPIDPQSLTPDGFTPCDAADLLKGLHSVRRELIDFKRLSEDVSRLSGELRKLGDISEVINGVPGTSKINSRLKTRFRKFRRLKTPTRVLLDAFTAPSRIGAYRVIEEKGVELDQPRALDITHAFYSDVGRGCERAIDLLDQTLKSISDRQAVPDTDQ